MSEHVPYDDFADIYDAWCETAPITRENQGFYVRRLVEASGPAVELGVGNGRICIEAARKGKPVLGVDSSRAILELCGKRAHEAGVSDRLTLIEGDFRDFEIPAPAELITIPFHSIGHLLEESDKRKALDNIHRQLLPGGRLIFDHFVFDPEYPMQPGVPRLRAELTDLETGRDVILWDATTRDDALQLLRIVAWTDELDSEGDVVRRRCRRIELSWMSPEQSRTLLEETGFEVENAYGDFQENALGPQSTHQIWVARRAR